MNSMNEITLSSDHVYRVNNNRTRSVTQIIKEAGLMPGSNFFSKESAQRGTPGERS